MYCMHCGEKIADSSRYCKYCGKLVAEDEIRVVGDKEEVEKAVDNAEVVATDEIIEAVDADNNNGVEEAVDVENIDSVDILIKNTEDKIQKEEVPVIEDYFLEHISKRKKICLFLVAVFLIAIVAVVVFAVFYPELL